MSGCASNKPPGLSERGLAADDARRAMGNDFFGGWTASDVELFQRYARRSDPAPGMIVDFLGVKTSIDLAPWASYLGGRVISEVPIPDDDLRAEAIEHFALLHSIEASGDTFSIVEIGACYAPWACTAAVVGRHAGRSVTLTAVEASRYLFDLIPRHLADNGIPLDGSVRLIHGAAAPQAGTAYIPLVTSASENGGQAVPDAREVDYLGRSVQHETVTALALGEVLPAGVTDFLHVDIQGTEAELLQANATLLNERVRSVFVGTHSRKIEGELLELFHAQGWALVRERPTAFRYRADRPSIAGWTTRDGGQYWRNPRIR